MRHGWTPKSKLEERRLLIQERAQGWANQQRARLYFLLHAQQRDRHSAQGTGGISRHTNSKIGALAAHLPGGFYNGSIQAATRYNIGNLRAEDSFKQSYLRGPSIMQRPSSPYVNRSSACWSGAGLLMAILLRACGEQMPYGSATSVQFRLTARQECVEGTRMKAWGVSRSNGENNV